MTPKFVPREKFADFIAEAARAHELFGQRTREGEQPHLERLAHDLIRLGGARAVEPLKTFLFPPREDLGDTFAAEPGPEPKPVAVVGATACDLRALKLLDDVFLGGEFRDPYYEKRRQNLLLVSMDCTEPLDVCFCTFFRKPPFPEPQDGHDLNLSPLAGGEQGYLVEAASAKGRSLLDLRVELAEATPTQLAARDQHRRRAADIVDRQARAAGLDAIEGITQKFRESRAAAADFWPRHANKCVECGACNFICPACHCFLLVDVEQRGKFRRFKHWDSCLLLAFARVAGGANPRARRVERLQNRFEKKFDFLISTLGHWGCTGCGRCTQACAGDIDVREVIRDVLQTQSVSTAP